MPMIDTAEIKPASDAVQAAVAAYNDAGQAYATERNRHPNEAVALQRAFEAMSRIGKAYEDSKFALSHIVYQVVGKAERTATSPK